MYEISLWLIWVVWPHCVPSQDLTHAQSLDGRGMLRDSNTAVPALLTSAQNAGVSSPPLQPPVPSTALWWVLWKMNSTPDRPNTYCLKNDKCLSFISSSFAIKLFCLRHHSQNYPANSSPTEPGARNHMIVCLCSSCSKFHIVWTHGHIQNQNLAKKTFAGFT